MREESKVYLDSNATTLISNEVRSLVQDFIVSGEYSGNPSSIHWGGRAIKTRLRQARQRLAEGLNVGPLELVFTSGASESNNTVLRGLADLAATDRLPITYQGRSEFITSMVEHPSVARVFQFLETRGHKVHWIPVSRNGELDMEAFKSALSERTLLASVMMANNETGNVFHVGKLCKWTHQAGGLFHTDAVQALGKIPVDLKALNVDYASFSAHKFHALKGTGLLYVKKNSPFQPLILGGPQERARRGGTENTLGILSFGEMAKVLPEVPKRSERIRELRDHLENRVLSEIPGVRVTGREGDRLPNTSSLVIDGVDGETLLMSLDLQGYAVSTGAACSSGSPEPSPVLRNMGLSRAEAQSSLRVSLSAFNTRLEIERFVNELIRVVNHLRSLNAFERPAADLEAL